MPIYEYKCKQCGGAFEALVYSADEAAAVNCPKCGSKRIQKALSGFAVASNKPEGCAPKSCDLPGGGCGCAGCPK